MVIGSLTSEYGQRAVFSTKSLEPFAQFKLGHTFRKSVLLLENHFLRHIGIEIIDALDADSLQHTRYILRSVRNITITHFRKVLYKQPRQEVRQPQTGQIS